MKREPKIRTVKVPLTARQYLALDEIATREDRSLAWTVANLIDKAARP